MSSTGVSRDDGSQRKRGVRALASGWMKFLDEAEAEVERNAKTYVEAVKLRAVQKAAADGRNVVTSGDVIRAANGGTSLAERLLSRKSASLLAIGFLLIGAASGPLWGVIEDQHQVPVALTVCLVGVVLAALSYRRGN